MTKEVKRKVILTGASSGIGNAIAKELALQGCFVIATARRQAPLVMLKDEFPGLVKVVPLDIAEPASAQVLAKSLLESEGDYPVLINAAGIGKFEDFKSSEFCNFELQMEVNFMAAARLIHACLPALLGTQGGLIVNISSIAANVNLPGSEGYAASKAALSRMGKVLLESYRAQGLRLTTIIPGAVDTPIWDGFSSSPNRADMIPVSAIAEAASQVVMSPPDRNYDEIVVTPQKGIL